MTALGLWSVAAPLGTGLVLVAGLWPGGSVALGVRLLQACLALGLGIGLSSQAFACALVLGGGTLPALVAADVALLAAAVGIAVIARRRRVSAPPTSSPRAPAALRLALATCVVVALAAAVWVFVAQSASEPHGEWDAWAIWNLRARCLARAGVRWRVAFDGAFMHTDYPLLLPGAVARVWRYLSAEPPLVPVVVHALLAFATAGLLAGALTMRRGSSQGRLAVLALLGTPAFFERAAWQYADVPLAFFFLATIVVVSCAASTAQLALAGAIAGLAAWTKNEGALIVAAVVAGQLAHPGGTHTRARTALPFLLGLLPTALLYAYFKLAIAAPNDLLAGREWSALAGEIADWERYRLIARAGLDAVAHSTGWMGLAALAYVCLLGRTADRTARQTGTRWLLVVGLVLAGYAAVFLITPHDLAWHLSTSADRLVLQVYPTILFVAFGLAACPEERLPASARS